MAFYSDLQALFTLHGLLGLAILSMLELILGVDNIIFISLIISRVPEENRFRTRVIALSLAFLMRAILLFSLVSLSRITTTLFSIYGFPLSVKDILFFIGGAYLAINTSIELVRHLHNRTETNAMHQTLNKSIIIQIVLVDMLFSFDSIFTAIGLMPNLITMILAVGIGMVFMVYLSGQTSKFLEQHPPVKTIALGFVIIMGLSLILQAFHLDIPKGYLYVTLGVIFLLERGYNMVRR